MYVPPKSAFTPVTGCGIVYWWVPSGASRPAAYADHRLERLQRPERRPVHDQRLERRREYGVTLSCPAPPLPPVLAVPEEYSAAAAAAGR